MADLGRKIRTFETDKPIEAPSFTPPVKISEPVEVPVVERELVPVRMNP